MSSRLNWIEGYLTKRNRLTPASQAAHVCLCVFDLMPGEALFMCLYVVCVFWWSIINASAFFYCTICLLTLVNEVPSAVWDNGGNFVNGKDKITRKDRLFTLLSI